MGRLVYCLNVSLDGFVAAADGGLEWATVDEEVHGWFNEQERSMDASLYGRRLYETMATYWPTGADDPQATPAMVEFAHIWNAKPIVVFSSTLRDVVLVVRADEAHHRDVNHGFANELAGLPALDVAPCPPHHELQPNWKQAA